VFYKLKVWCVLRRKKVRERKVLSNLPTYYSVCRLTGLSPTLIGFQSRRWVNAYVFACEWRHDSRLITMGLWVFWTKAKIPRGVTDRISGPLSSV
jgi:hypothetical protein